MKTSNLNFGEALAHLKLSKHSGDYTVTRKAWYNTFAEPLVKLQMPDLQSKMTESYLYMQKRNTNSQIVRFPLDLSCESILAEDWMIII